MGSCVSEVLAPSHLNFELFLSTSHKRWSKPKLTGKNRLRRLRSPEKRSQSVLTNPTNQQIYLPFLLPLNGKDGRSPRSPLFIAGPDKSLRSEQVSTSHCLLPPTWLQETWSQK